MKKYKYKITGLDCAMCAQRVEDYLRNEKKFSNISLNFAMETLQFETEEEYSKEKLVQELQKVEPDVSLEELKEESTENSGDIFRIFLGVILFLIT